MLKMTTSKKQVTKSVKKKKKIFEISMFGTPDDDDATNTYDIDLSKCTSSQHYREEKAGDVDLLINDAFEKMSSTSEKEILD